MQSGNTTNYYATVFGSLIFLSSFSEYPFYTLRKSCLPIVSVDKPEKQQPLKKLTMRKLVLSLLVSAFSPAAHALFIQQVRLDPASGNNISLHLKVVDGYIFQYHNYTYTVENNTITLTVCYNPVMIPSVTTLENDFLLENVNFTPANYTLIVNTHYRHWVDNVPVCDDAIYPDTETFSFVAPLTQSVTLSAPEFSEAASGVTLFPNPTTGLLTLENKSIEIQAVKVFDNMGRTVKTIMPDKMLDISDLNNGIYFIECNTNLSRWISKIILSK